jgi:hypothetical protein
MVVSPIRTGCKRNTNCIATAVLVFDDRRRVQNGSRALEICLKRVNAIRRGIQVARDDLLAVFIQLGTLEAAVADALCPAREERISLLCAFRQAMDALGRAFLATCNGATTHHLATAADHLGKLPAGAMPSAVNLSTPEGFAFYALYPEAYAEAAAEWGAATRPARVVCLGLRSIGTTLASVARAGLEERGVTAATWTLRPRGHPFDRTVAFDRGLVSGWSPERATFLLVDEGPGLSGSSLAGAAAALSNLGVPDNRIVLLAAWNPDPAHFRSESARRQWARHVVLTAGFDRMRGALRGDGILPADAVNVSGGLWRQHFSVAAPWPTAHPQHERMKFVIGGRAIARFAGLGDHGQRIRDRATRVAAAGWTAPPGALQRGLLQQPRVAGRVMSAADVDASLLSHAADYIAWLRKEESGTEAASIGPLTRMLRVNAGEGLGSSVLPEVDALVANAEAFTEPATAIDGRFQVHEWVRTRSGFIKVDALDHHVDHFLPGCTDAAWDVAGLFVEAAVPPAERAALLHRYARACGDTTIAARLPFYLAAYAAFRLGYTTLAAESLAGDEGRRFEAERQRYADALRAALNTKWKS